MKKGILITAGSAFILAIFGVWVYLMFFGTPANPEELFADLGFDEETFVPREELPPVPLEQTDSIVDVGVTALTQLTLRPVAGYTLTANASSTAVRYAEGGVGHVYEIDLSTGIETRVFGKTFAAITDAHFAPSGGAVVLVAENGREHTAYLEEIPDAEDEMPDRHDFAADARNIEFISDTEVRYTRETADGLTGYRYDLASEEVTELFTIPFRDAAIVWTNDASYAYNRPAPYLQSGLYAIEGNVLRRHGATAYGLSAFAHASDVAHVRTLFDLERDVLISFIAENGEERLLPIAAIPEKCDFHETDPTTLWCGGPVADLAREYQSDWYKGTLTANDMLWRIDTLAQEAVLEVDLQGETGRMIDVEGLASYGDGRYVLFANKTDGTLWLYDAEFERNIAPAPTEETSAAEQE